MNPNSIDKNVKIINRMSWPRFKLLPFTCVCEFQRLFLITSILRKNEKIHKFIMEKSI